MILKTVGGGLIVLSTSAIGCLLAGRMKEQERLLSAIRQAVLFLVGELNYRRLPLPEAFAAVAERQQGHLRLFFETMAEALRKKEGSSFTERWCREAKLWLAKSPLNLEQQAAFLELGESLLIAEEESRTRALELYGRRLEEELLQLARTGKDQRYLYRMLGILSGMFLWILVI